MGVDNLGLLAFKNHFTAAEPEFIWLFFKPFHGSFSSGWPHPLTKTAGRL